MLQTKFPGIERESSALGFGCMRLPTKDGRIDEEKAIAMIRHAIDSGVKYIDTAYPYHGGESEVIVGKALQDGYRERVILTTKLPVWNVKEYGDMMRILDEQLAKLQTDHVDFYLLHAMNKDRFVFMSQLDYKRFFSEALAAGKIRYPGFSFHDDAETFLRILNDYDWKMCQVQMNILDDENQATLEGIREAGRKGIGVVIMEPLRGGLLANPPANVQAVYDAAPGEKRSPVEWAFRYLYTMPEVITILSGMSTPEQLDDNLRIFGAATRDALSDQERQLFVDVKAAYMSRIRTRCTGCAYCQPCPMGVKIPNAFRGYDESLLFDRSFEKGYQRLVDEQADPSRCVACRKCERACPQHLPVVDYLKEIRAAVGR